MMSLHLATLPRAELIHCTQSLNSALSRWCTALACILMFLSGPIYADKERSADSLISKDATLSGMWWIEDFQPRLLPESGAEFPFTAAGRQEYQRNGALLAAGKLADPGISICLPEGLPRTVFAVYPMQIVEHGQWVTFIHEINHTFWSASLNGKHSAPDDIDPAFMGESVAHWDRGVLVVDSIGFKARSFLDEAGLPHSDKLHVILRFRRLSHRELEVLATIDDPDIFTAAWSTRRLFELRPDIRLTEFVCGEPHRTLTGNRGSATPLKWVAK